MELPDRPFIAAEIPELGLSNGIVRAAVLAGEVRRPFRGVYVPAALPDTVETRVRALGLVLAPGQVACDRTAAWLHGVELLSLAERAALPPVEFTAFRWHTRSRLPGVRGRTRELTADDVMQLGPTRVTTPLRTALDLGCNVHRRDALAALDQFRRLHDVSLQDLQRGCLRFRGRRGVVQLRELVPLSDPRAESVRESWTRLAIRDAGLPAPEPQFWVEIDGVPAYRLDLGYPAHRVAVEYDGAEFHQQPRQREYDGDRRWRLGELGWRFVVVRNGDFSGDRLHVWTEQLRRELADRPNNLRW